MPILISFLKEVLPVDDQGSLLPHFKLFSRRSAVSLIFALLSAVLQLLCGGWYASAIVFALLFLVLGIVHFHLPAKAQLPVFLLVFLCAVVVIFWLSQYSLDAPLSFLISRRVLCLGLLICAIVLLVFLLLTAHPFWGLCIGMCALLLFATINYYVFAFRGTEFTPSDMLSFTTALNTVETYVFIPSLHLVRAWVILLLFLFSLSALNLELHRRRLSLVSVPLLVLMGLSLICGMQSLTPEYYTKGGTLKNGFFLNFTLQLGQTFVKKPSDYNPDLLRALPYDNESALPSSYPVIIVIMNESFSDLSVFGETFKTDEEVMPFYRSLNENTIKGYACSSVYGGSTANSEFEFLTGHSMAFLPVGSIPYQQYLRDNCYSMISVLKKYGYICVSMTPCLGGSWNLLQVYPNMGFDEMYYLDYFKTVPKIRSFTSDHGMYEKMIQYYEQRDKSMPLFLFGVTMQNHGSYTVDETLYPSVIHLKGFSESYPDAEQYLTLIHESDDALAYLINYFSGVNENVVIVFFGDHQPKLSSDFYGELHGSETDTLDERQKDFRIPYVIWTNYDSPAQTPPLTSLNYLGNYVYTAAGIPLPAYSQYLQKFQQLIPAINSVGYYSHTAGCFLPLSDATGEEAETLCLYEQLEYNALFDKQNRLPMFLTQTDE